MKGIHSEALGIKKYGSDPVDFMTNLIEADVTFDPPSLATVTGAVSSGITMTGAQVGDRVVLFPPYDMSGVLYQGDVSAADTVKITLFNTTGNSGQSKWNMEGAGDPQMSEVKWYIGGQSEAPASDAKKLPYVGTYKNFTKSASEEEIEKMWNEMRASAIKEGRMEEKPK